MNHKLDMRLVAFIIILPLVLGFLYIKFFGVNVIYWDQWALVPIIEKLHTNGLTFGDLFVTANISEEK